MNENMSIDEYESLKKEYLDILNDSIDAFRELLNIQYNITVARKGNTFLLNLIFIDKNFYHMIGLKYLTDVAAVNEIANIYDCISKNDILSQNIKEQLVASEHFNKIIGRLYALIYLRDNFYNAKDNKHYKFMSKEYGNYTSIEYDYIIKSEYNGVVYYYFLRYHDKLNNPNECVIVSLFTEGEVDLSRGQAYMTLLEKVEINKKTNDEIEIYKRN